jgi:hypothetical protein
MLRSATKTRFCSGVGRRAPARPAVTESICALRFFASARMGACLTASLTRHLLERGLLPITSFTRR